MTARRHVLTSLEIRKRTPAVLEARGLANSIRKWDLVDAGDLVILFGTVNLRFVDRLERYTDDHLLHHLSTVCDGLPCVVSNTNGLRYAFILSHKPTLPKSVDFPGIERGVVRLGVGVGNREIALKWDKLDHLLVAGITRSGKSNFLRLLAHQAIGDSARLLLADIDGRTFPMLTRNPALMMPIATSPNGVHELVARGLAECDRRSVIYGTVEGHPETLEEYNAQAVKEGAEALPRLVVLLDEFNATALALGGAKGAFAGDVASLCWRGLKFGIHVVVAAQDFAKDIVGRMRDQTSAVLFRTKNSHLARDVRCKDAVDLPAGRKGLAVTERWGMMQTYYIAKTELASGQPDILSEKELRLVAWAIVKNEGYLSLAEIQEHGKMGQGQARRLASEWERRAWLKKDERNKNKRRMTRDFVDLIYKLKALQTLQTPRNRLQTDLQTGNRRPTHLQTADKQDLPPFLQG